MKILLRHLVFVRIFYFLDKLIEKYFLEHANPELKKKLDK